MKENALALLYTDRLTMPQHASVNGEIPIGFAIAKSFASDGAHVCVNGRTQERVDAATEAIRSHAAATRVDGIATDFSGSAGAEAVISKLPAVDVLVNNVGIFEPKPFCGNSRCGLVPPLRDRCDERSAALATLSGRDAGTELGSNCFSCRANRGFRFRRKWCTTE